MVEGSGANGTNGRVDAPAPQPAPLKRVNSRSLKARADRAEKEQKRQALRSTAESPTNRGASPSPVRPFVSSDPPVSDPPSTGGSISGDRAAPAATAPAPASFSSSQREQRRRLASRPSITEMLAGDGGEQVSEQYLQAKRRSITSGHDDNDSYSYKRASAEGGGGADGSLRAGSTVTCQPPVQVAPYRMRGADHNRQRSCVARRASAFASRLQRGSLMQAWGAPGAASLSSRWAQSFTPAEASFNNRNSFLDADPTAERRASTQGSGSPSKRRFGLGGKPRRIKESAFLLELYSAHELRGIILPFSRFRTLWDLVVLVFVLYTALSLPIILAYPDATEYFRAVNNFELLMDVFFMLDIIINFRTAYIENAELVIDKNKIYAKYLLKWFPIDLVASIPWELIFRIYELTTPEATIGYNATSGEQAGGGDVQILVLVKILKTPKLLRVGRMLKFLERIEGAANVGRIFGLVTLMAFVVHWISCIWFVVASSDDGYLVGAGLRDLPWYDQYLDNFYTTLMMVMGDSTSPITKVETFFASTIVLIGATMNATIFANVASYVAQIGAMNAQHKARIEAIVRATRLLRVPDATSHRIRAYFDYCWLRHMDFAGQNLVNELPVQLRRSVSLQTHERKLRKLSIFATVDERFIAALATHMAPEVYLPDEYILTLGQVSNKAYFVERGRVHIIWRTDAKHAPRFVVRQDYFGEYGLFQSKQHLYSARAMTHCDTYALNRADFEEVMRQHPAVAVQIADMLPSMLSKPAAKQAVEDIYKMVGISGLLKIFQQGKWRPLRGLAARITALRHDEEFMRRMPRPSGNANGYYGGRQRSRRASREAEDEPEGAAVPTWQEPAIGDGVSNGASALASPDRGGEGGAGRPSTFGGGLEVFDTGGAGAEADDLPGVLSKIDGLDAPPPGGRRPTSPFAAGRRPTSPAGVVRVSSPRDGRSLAELTRAQEGLAAQVASMAAAQKRVEALLGAIASKVGVDATEPPS